MASRGQEEKAKERLKLDSAMEFPTLGGAPQDRDAAAVSQQNGSS